MLEKVSVAVNFYFFLLVSSRRAELKWYMLCVFNAIFVIIAIIFGFFSVDQIIHDFAKAWIELIKLSYHYPVITMFILVLLTVGFSLYFRENDQPMPGDPTGAIPLDGNGEVDQLKQ